MPRAQVRCAARDGGWPSFAACHRIAVRTRLGWDASDHQDGIVDAVFRRPFYVSVRGGLQGKRQAECLGITADDGWRNGMTGERMFIVEQFGGLHCLRCQNRFDVQSFLPCRQWNAKIPDGSTGRRMRKHDPWLTVLSTSIRPPCRSTMLFTIARPRPVPGTDSAAPATR